MPTVSLYNWVQQTGPALPNPQQWGTVCYGGGVYIALSYIPTRDASGNQATYAARSTDGITWTYSKLTGPTGYLNTGWVESAWGDPSGNGTGIFVALGSAWSGGGDYATQYNTIISTDGGNTWTFNDGAYGAGKLAGVRINGITYGMGMFMVSINGPPTDFPCGLARSTDGVTWVAITTLVNRYPLLTGLNQIKVRYANYGNGNGAFLALGAYTPFSISYDGINWTMQDPESTMLNAFGQIGISDIAYGNGTWVATMVSGPNYNSTTNLIFTSPSGITGTWVRRYLYNTDGFRNIMFGHPLIYDFGYFIAYNAKSGSNMAVSTYGIDWSAKYIDYILDASGVDPLGNWNAICCGGDKFVTVSGKTTFGETVARNILNNIATMDLQLFVCFKEGSKILCLVDNEEKYVEVQNLRRGDLVKTLHSGYKAVELIGSSQMYNPANKLRGKDRLYKCTPEKYPELTEDLIITGCHSILIDEDLTADQIERMSVLFSKVCVTEDKYRLMACVDDRAEPYEEEGLHTIWHFALEHEDIYMNYGVFANGGLMVETSSIRMMREYSGLELI